MIPASIAFCPQKAARQGAASPETPDVPLVIGDLSMGKRTVEVKVHLNRKKAKTLTSMSKTPVQRGLHRPIDEPRSTSASQKSSRALFLSAVFSKSRIAVLWTLAA